MIVGGGGVGLIPCNLGCINGVDSSLHFFFERFVLILGIFLKKSSIGSWWQLVDCCWWWRVVLVGGGGRLCLCVVVGLLLFCACVCVW